MTKAFGDLVEVSNFMIKAISEAQRPNAEASTAIKELEKLLQQAILKSLNEIPLDQENKSPYKDWIERDDIKPYWLKKKTTNFIKR